MTTAYKVLGQAAPAATVLTDLYVVPDATSAVISSIFINDVGDGGGAASVSIAVGGAADAPEQYLYGSAGTGLPIDPDDTFVATVGITLAAGDVIRVRNLSGSDGEIAFQVFGAENS